MNPELQRLKVKAAVLKHCFAQLRKAAWDESKHPRDDHGRFSDAFASIDAELKQKFEALLSESSKPLTMSAQIQRAREGLDFKRWALEQQLAEPAISSEEKQRIRQSLRSVHRNIQMFGAPTQEELATHNRMLARQGTPTLGQMQGWNRAITPFSDPEHEALLYYVQDSSMVNDWLRQQKLARDQAVHGDFTESKETRSIDSAFTKIKPLDEDIIVYRGLDREAADKLKQLSSIKEGVIVTDHGYTSTSTSHGAAALFAKYGGLHGKAAGEVAKIKVPAGSKALFLPGLQREAILPRGTRFSVWQAIAGGVTHLLLKVLR